MSLEFETKNVLKIIDDFYIKRNLINKIEFSDRELIIIELNDVFFPDKIAKFVDYTKDESGRLALMIEFKNCHYNILAYEVNIKEKIERIRKLKKINNKYYEFRN